MHNSDSFNLQEHQLIGKEQNWNNNRVFFCIYIFIVE